MNNVIVENYSYDVFGAPTIYDVNYTEISSSAVGNPYMFTARRADDETALYYYRARYYAFDIGRFLQTDPIGYDDGLNMYTYCGNNPLIWSDPYGLCKDSYMPTAGEWAGAFLGGAGEGLYNIFVDPVVAVGDYYGNFRDAGMGRFTSGASALNMGVGKVVGYSTLLEGIMGLNARDVRLTSGWERTGQVVIGAIQTAFSAVAASELLHAATTPKATSHGAGRMADPSRLNGVQTRTTRLLPTKTMTQADGAKVFIREVAPDKFNVVVSGENGVITTLKHVSNRAIERLATNYGWK